MTGVQELQNETTGRRHESWRKTAGRVSVLALALTLDWRSVTRATPVAREREPPALPSDVKRQHVFPTAFVKQILDGFRGEQIPNHGARLSHERT